MACRKGSAGSVDDEIVSCKAIPAGVGMRRIHIARESVGNYGHLGCCLPIAEALRKGGQHAAFAVRDTRTAAELRGPAVQYATAAIEACASTKQSERLAVLNG